MIKFCSPLLLLSLSVVSLFAAEEGLWRTDLEAAKKEAAEGEKVLLLSFTGSDWCPGCIQLREEVFEKDVFGAGVAEHFVLVELDFPKDRSKMEAGEFEKREVLLDQYLVEEFPTVILADEEGRPFARTALSVFQPEDAADYVKHLEQLRERRSLRDEAFASAENLEGVDKARALLDAIGDFSDLTVDTFYPQVVKSILAADVDDETGYREAREYRMAVMAYEESVEEKFREGKFADVIGLADGFLVEREPTGEDRQHILMAKLMALVETGKAEEAFGLLGEIKAIAPESEIGLELDRLRGRMEVYFREQGVGGGPEGEVEEPAGG